MHWHQPHAVLSCAATILSVAMAAPASALTPSEVFDKVSPSVWAVRALDAEERPLSYGSAVVVAPGQLVTNCHVLRKAKFIRLRRENVSYDAQLEHADAERDLCLLSVKNFSAPAVTVGSIETLRIGQRVFAIGNPERLALTLSDGLISGLRGEEGTPLVQTTAPISPGSSGGGLFDEQARLVGITTLIYLGRSRIAQNLNFALPAEWLAEIPSRAAAQLEAHRGGDTRPAAQGADERPAIGLGNRIAAMPSVGATWKYSFSDRRYSGTERTFTIRIAAIDDSEVREVFALNTEQRSLSVNPKAMRFTSWRLSNGYSVIELAPYLFSAQGRELRTLAPTHYPAGTLPWLIDPPRVQEEDTTVPAGAYKAVRVDITGTTTELGNLATIANEHLAARFHYTAWYAAEVNRYVKVRHQTWNLRDTLVSDEIVQLMEHTGN